MSDFPKKAFDRYVTQSPDEANWSEEDDEDEGDEE